MNTDLQGDKDIYNALCKIKGINFQFSNAICTNMKIDKNKKINELSKDEITNIEKFIKNPESLSPYLLNRQKDYDTGKNLHLSTTDLKLRKDFDQKRLQKTKSYRGLRLAAGLPVRGQRTKAHFRKGKAVGVAKKKGKGKK